MLKGTSRQPARSCACQGSKVAAQAYNSSATSAVGAMGAVLCHSKWGKQPRHQCAVDACMQHGDQILHMQQWWRGICTTTSCQQRHCVLTDNICSRAYLLQQQAGI